MTCSHDHDDDDHSNHDDDDDDDGHVGSGLRREQGVQQLLLCGPVPQRNV